MSNLVHIGLFKSGSTYLQQAWQHNPSVNLVYSELLSIIAAARNISLNTPPDQDNLFLSFEEQKYNILSNEGLSCSFINERKDREFLHFYQDVTAEIIHSLIGESKVLIVTREPISWILSTYNQAVKQGSYLSFKDFISFEKRFIEQMLDIKDIVSIWSKFNKSENILVLPFELLKENSSDFFKEIHNFCGSPTPSEESLKIINKNPSIRPDELKVLRAFNKWIDIFMKKGMLAKCSLPDDFGEAINSIRFAMRYSLEELTPELENHLQPLKDLVEDCGIDTEVIDKAWLKDIREVYCDFLNGSDFFGYKALYCG